MLTEQLDEMTTVSFAELQGEDGVEISVQTTGLEMVQIKLVAGTLSLTIREQGKVIIREQWAAPLEQAVILDRELLPLGNYRYSVELAGHGANGQLKLWFAQP